MWKLYILNSLTCIKSLLSGDSHQSQRARSSDLSMLPSKIIESRRKGKKPKRTVFKMILHLKEQQKIIDHNNKCIRQPQHNYLFSTVIANHVESVAPLESTSGMDLSKEESSSCFTSRYVDFDETNFTSLTMMSSTTMLYWLRTQTHHLNHS